MLKKYKNSILLISIIILLVALKIFNIEIVKKISLVNYDLYQKLLVKGEVKNITIIDIDEKSITAIGQFPWRRDIYAKILNNINKHKPASIAFDIFFSEEDKQNPKNLLLELKKIIRNPN
jgi:adenylate cyclase